MIKVIIAGGRHFYNYELLKEKCNNILCNETKIEIVSGCAKGADLLGELYSKDCGYKLKQFPADWNKYGLKAGPIRNGLMADYADALIAFWDGKSKGTNSMIKLARDKGLKVRVIKY